MANQNTLPLYEKIWLKYTFSRVMDSLILLLLILLLSYRVFSHNIHTFPWFVAFLCESWFTFTWVLIISTKWTPAYTITYLDRLSLRVPEAELPQVDLFVTTADPVLEPPIITINTVLSLLALDYPANKLACFVSDDGCSPLTFYALVEATKFAKLWVPFCKKYNIQVRAPFRYFNGEITANNNEGLPEFKQELLRMKDEYEHLSCKIQNATQESISLDGELAIFSKVHPRNHPTIIKILWENKEGLSDGVPHLIYISREKRPGNSHHYKAGAMNVLTRVSGLTTNAPFILNVDCDMYVNNPKIALHALCILLDSKGEKEVAFAQCPQQFYDGLKDDPLGNQLEALFVYIGGGPAGLQGVFYSGTNCLHRRKVIYGLSPDPDTQNGKKDLAFTNGKLSEKEIVFGTSKGFVESAANALEGKNIYIPNVSLSNYLEAANEVAGCAYEYGTAWGEQGLGLWIPTTLLVVYNISTLSEYWMTGLSIRTWWNNQAMARITTTGAWFFGFLAILLKLLRISDTVFEITRKEQTFSSDSVTNENAGRFIFNESPIFLPGTTILLVQLTALVINWLGWQPPARSGNGSGAGEVFCSAYLVVCYWPFLKGLIEKGKYGIPLSTICKSMVLAFLFVGFCRSTVSE